MIDFVLNSGLLSVTFWAALLTFVAVLASWLRAPRTPALPTFVTAALFLAFLVVGTFVSLGYGLYKAYVSPRDLLQDIVSAREYLAGHSLYPDNMNERMREAVASEPPRRSPFWWSPR